jgi:hypothetical protein
MPEKSIISNRRTSGDFIKDLRAEIINSQDRRGKLLLLKLTFVSSFFGLGSFKDFSIEAGNIVLESSFAFYLIPFIALIFDLYLMGEDYGIKRAGNFIRKNKYTPTAEKEWEIHLSTGKRDNFSTSAYIVSASLIYALCLVIIGLSLNWSGWIFWVWALIASSSVIVQLFYKKLRKKRLE